MSTSTSTPRVWIGCLASYNAGRLIGEWVDATDVDEMNECRDWVAAQAVDAAKKAGEYPLYFGDPEEFFIADYDGFGNLSSTLGEYASFEQVARVGALIEDHGDEFIAFVDACEPDLDEVTEDEFYQHQRGEWDSEEAYAENYVCEVGWGDVPAGKIDLGGYPKVEVNPIESLLPYLDMEMIARELFQHGTFTSVPAGSGKVYVFETEV